MKKPFMLMILDGFGIAPPSSGNAIAKAVKPNLDKIFEKYPHTLLSASGLAVGIPEGQMGTSEVGHLNIGAGRIVYQEPVSYTHLDVYKRQGKGYVKDSFFLFNFFSSEPILYHALQQRILIPAIFPIDYSKAYA